MTEFEILSLYLQDYIRLRRPLSVDETISIYSQTGFIEKGHNGEWISFETWKYLNKRKV